MLPEAASAASQDQAGGLFMLAWGLFATTIGVGLATNFHGMASNFTRQAADSSAWLRKLPPWKWQRQDLSPARMTRPIRLIAVPFAIVGPIMIIAGILSMTHGHIASHDTASPGPFGLVFVAFALVAVTRLWLSPSGMMRTAARRGGWRLAAAALGSLSGLAFAASLAMGQITIGIVGWVISGICSLSLLTEDKPPKAPRPDGTPS